MILTVKDEEVLIEYILGNQVPLKDVVDCIVNNEKVHLSKRDLALSNMKIENFIMQQNKWLAVVFIASFIGILSFVVDMIMVKKWFSVRNTTSTINTFVSEAAKQQAGAISLFNTIRGGESVGLSGSHKEYTSTYK